MFSRSNSRRETETAQKPGLGVPSILSTDFTVTGNVASSGEVHLDGTVEGDIDARVLTVGENAQVRGNISAETVRISGSVTGTIRAKEVILTRSARITGDIHHDVLSMEAGARLEGMCRRLASLLEADKESDEASGRLLLTQQETAA